jgi:hypothetical protein
VTVSLRDAVAVLPAAAEVSERTCRPPGALGQGGQRPQIRCARAGILIAGEGSGSGDQQQRGSIFESTPDILGGAADTSRSD